MKQAVLLALTISLSVLCGCSGSERREQEFEAWRADFLAASEHSITAEVTALSEEGETQFIISCISDGDKAQLELLAPEALAGVKARTEAGEAELIYDGAVLSLGSDSAERCSPMTALPLLLEFLSQGHFEDAWTESTDDGEFIVTELEDSQGRRLLLWQEQTSMLPRFAAIRSGEALELKIQIQTIE